MKVLLIAHAPSPVQGSEPGVSWNWAWELSSFHEIWLLAHPRFQAEVERYLQENPNPNLHIVWVEPPKAIRLIDTWGTLGTKRGVRFHYTLWQRAAMRSAKALHRAIEFDIIHHVSWTTVSVPTKMWSLGPPFFWGPLGGAQTAPPAFRHYFGRSLLKETIRTVRIRFLSLSPSWKTTVRNSTVLFATNNETAKLLRDAGAENVRLMLDCGTPANWLTSQSVSGSSGQQLEMLWAGQIEPRKGLALALEALAKIPNLPIRLRIAGDGPSRAKSELLARQLGVESHVEFLGSVDWHEMADLYESSDVFIFTSLRDTFGSVVLEAMAHGLPILTLDHQGVGLFVPSKAAIKVPVTTPEETVATLAQGIRVLANDADLRLEMGRSARDFAKSQSWPRRAAQMSEWYREVAEV